MIKSYQYRPESRNLDLFWHVREYRDYLNRTCTWVCVLFVLQVCVFTFALICKYALFFILLRHLHSALLSTR